jgi:tungstate transport system ATP-binding protein
MSDATAYSIRSLIHSYDGKVVLDIPHLDIPSGQLCIFAGPNGCGKTTLLSILAFLLTPSSGRVRFQGIESCCQQGLWIRGKVTMVHQKPILFATTVHRNIAYGLKMLGLSPKEIKSRVQTIMGKTGLSDLAEKPARKLSGGEMQRVVLARALVLETPILLLDEPTNSLDNLSRPILTGLLRKANQRGVTIIIATHDLNFASSLPGRVIQMEGGRISEASGPEP